MRKAKGLTSVVAACCAASVMWAGLSGTAFGQKSQVLLAKTMDCVRDKGAIISAHRGGPMPGYPENAIETMIKTAQDATPLLEIDVSGTRDGVLVLMHDTTLDRTTTGTGTLADMKFAEISNLRLKDETGAETLFNIPTFDQALAWANGRAILLLDKKLGATWPAILDAVQRANAQGRVMAIAYSVVEAAEIRRLAPWIYISVPANQASDLAPLAAVGLSSEGITAFTGVGKPDASAWKSLKKAKVEVTFGTLGKPRLRLDDQFASDGDLKEYRELAKAGVAIISSDTPRAAANALKGSNAEKCLYKALDAR